MGRNSAWYGVAVACALFTQAAGAEDSGGQAVCLRRTQVDAISVLDERTLLVKMSDGTYLRNTLHESCPGLRSQEPIVYDHDQLFICANRFSFRAQGRNSFCKMGDFSIYAASTLAPEKRDTNALFDSANGHLAKGEADAAVADLTEAIAGAPQLGELRALRAVAYAATSRRDLAIADIDQAVALNPGSTEIVDVRVRLNTQLGRWAEVHRDCDSILARDPRNAVALYRRGDAKRHEGDAAGATADEGAAEALDPVVAKRVAQ